MVTFAYQPALRPALPCLYGPVDYREQRALFERIDLILAASGLERDFINLALADRRIGAAALLATPGDGHQLPSSAAFGLPEPVSFDDLFLDSTRIKADIHFPIDWVLPRDAARTLMKAAVLIRKYGLKNRMPREPLEFLSGNGHLRMKMTAKRQAADGRKQRKESAARNESPRETHRRPRKGASRSARDPPSRNPTRRRPGTTNHRSHGTRAGATARRAVKQAHERMIGGRRVANEDKILSLCDGSLNVIKRGKAGAAVEFGNKLWLGENRDGIIADCKLYQDTPGDSTLAVPATKRLVDDQKLDVKQVWGDRGLTSKANSAMLQRRDTGGGFCPRDAKVLAGRLASESGFREGLERRAGTEARIGIFKNVFPGRPLMAREAEKRAGPPARAA